ncbi:MAG: coenzyme F420-0:L-glutamate ligase [Dehalococcoidia bacterium]|tara:strand:+ start:2392 stop:3153 length:762 start_codon:yes stop_codon:yes gene_type:complete
MTKSNINIYALEGIPEIHAGDNLGEIIIRQLRLQDLVLEDGDVIVIAQKIVSKSEGRVIDLNNVKPSGLAVTLSKGHRRDARHTELILQESKRIVRMERGIIISETHHGFTCANAGIDASNIPGSDHVALLPIDPDNSARMIRSIIQKDLGFSVGVIISDTFGRPWRTAAVNVAIGIAGFNPIVSYVGESDEYGNKLYTSQINVADELSAAAELVTGKLDSIPVSVIRGFPIEVMENASLHMLIRDRDKDLFR